MKIEIKSFVGAILFEGNFDSLATALTEAIKKQAYLRGAYLRGADLRGADLRGAYLRGAYLREADLRGADLRGADLRGADLQEADLRGAKVNWQSHNMISEILFRAAGKDVEKRKIAGLVLVSTDWCWNEFLNIKDPLANWAIGELKKWVKEGDNIPKILECSLSNDQLPSAADVRGILKL